MATEAQIHANRENAWVNPPAPTPKPANPPHPATPSPSGSTPGADRVKPEERDLYKEFCEKLYAEPSPDGILEQSLAAEITGATFGASAAATPPRADLADNATAGGHA